MNAKYRHERSKCARMNKAKLMVLLFMLVFITLWFPNMTKPGSIIYTLTEDVDTMKNITLKEFFSVVDNRSDNIFIIWPLEPMLFYRALCSVESWSMNHPNSSVWFIFTVNELQDQDGLLHKLLAKYSNLQVIYIDLQKAFIGTPYYNFGLTSIWNTSKWPGVHICDFLRLALVWQKGGYYSDTDVFPVKNLDSQRNFLLSSGHRADCSLMHFDAHHPFLKAVMKTSVAMFDPNDYGSASVWPSTETAKRLCNITTEPILANRNSSYRECALEGNSSFRLLNFKYCLQCCHGCLIPGSGLHFEEFLKSDAYAFHICNKQTRGSPQTFNSSNLLQSMAERNCQFIYKQAQEHSNFW